jgi:diacylglycerol kinase family enzyme
VGNSVIGHETMNVRTVMRARDLRGAAFSEPPKSCGSSKAAARPDRTHGVERRIDVAEVNGRPFLNNVSLGIYGDAVRRPAYRDAKALTLAQTAAEVLGPSEPAAGLEVMDDRGRSHRDPAVVLVSNNPYSLEPPRQPGTRPALDSGQLGVVVLDLPAAGLGAGRTWTARQLEVTATAPVHAGIDGEAVELEPPLRFVIRPLALRVRLYRP